MYNSYGATWRNFALYMFPTNVPRLVLAVVRKPKHSRGIEELTESSELSVTTMWHTLHGAGAMIQKIWHIIAANMDEGILQLPCSIPASLALF